MRIGFIGGTGDEGKGLAYRLAKAGHRCSIGSRSAERAEAAAGELRAKDAALAIDGGTNADVAAASEIVLVTTPYEGLDGALPPLAEALAGRIAVSTVVPMAFADGRASLMRVEEGSAAERIQGLLPRSRVVAAFQNLSAKKLLRDAPVEADVVVCADDGAAKAQVIDLAGQIAGVRGIDGGGLANSQLVEGITVLLVSINRNYKINAGIRIAGVK
ncbi:MAG TPA: NADPH-dependent F420 reductase [Dehalococcoidia bacterium]|nr:NADPH-dependent F420 reductase [Dehalococcoidia bacterium]